MIMGANQLGDLDVRLLRPDGSTDRLRDVVANLNDVGLWLDFFQTGLLDIPSRRLRWNVQDRRPTRPVRPDERCRIVVMRASLEKLVPAKKSRRYVEDDSLVAEGLAGIQTMKWANPLQAATALADRAKGTSPDATVTRLRKKISGALEK
jgi:hypothetical protein